MALHDRLVFVDEACGIADEFNRGFLKGSRLAHSAFILKVLIHKHIMQDENRFGTLVDFAKASDQVNKHILFYKLFTSGLRRR